MVEIEKEFSGGKLCEWEKGGIFFSFESFFFVLSFHFSFSLFDIFLLEKPSLTTN